MSTIGRTLGNLRKVGIKGYFRQLLYIGDTKAGTLVGTDRAGNKYFENLEELPLRHRWVEYAKHDYDASQIDTGWHAWMSHMIDTPPSQDPIFKTGTRATESEKPLPNFSMSRGAYKTYSTTQPKLAAWEPVAAVRR